MHHADDDLAVTQLRDKFRRRRADACQHVGPANHVVPARDRRAG